MSVKHSEWIISEYIKRGFFREIRNEKHNMIFSFSNIDALRVFLLNSFMFEYDWDDESQKKLTQLVSSKYKRELEQIDLVEIIKFRVLIKEDSQGDFDE